MILPVATIKLVGFIIVFVGIILSVPQRT